MVTIYIIDTTMESMIETITMRIAEMSRIQPLIVSIHSREEP
jgi:hypothetical protein